MKKHSQSVLDSLLQILPKMDNKGLMKNNIVSHKAADTLFAIWKNPATKVSSNFMVKPTTMSADELKIIESEGLARNHGDKIELTARGLQVIKTLVLGDDKSIYEDKGKQIDYRTALANLKNPTQKQAKKRQDINKQKTDEWWARFLK